MNRLLVTTVAILTLITTGCATTRIVKPEDSRLTCAAEPAVPGAAGVAVTDEQAGEYKVALRGAWYDCRTTVEWLRIWFSKLPD